LRTLKISLKSIVEIAVWLYLVLMEPPELMREAVEENIRERDLVDGSRGRNLSGY